MRRVGIAGLLGLVLLGGGLFGRPGGQIPRKPVFRPGAVGAGDPYFPTYGNGGYDVAGYDLDLRYDPKSGELGGTATITATATQDLSRFDFDLAHLTAKSVRVDGAEATATTTANELVVTPAAGIVRGKAFTVRGRLRRDAGPVGQQDARRGRLAAHHRRGGRARPARVGEHLVSGQRPPLRQGHLQAGHDRAGRPPGDQQRGARAAAQRRRLDHLAVDRELADGQLSVHCGDRQVPGDHHDARRQADGRRDSGVGARGRPGRPVDRPHRGDRRLPGHRVRAVPVRCVRRNRGCRPADQVRAGDPVAPGLRSRRSSAAGRTPRWSRTNSPTSGSATASRWSAGRTSGSTRASPRTPSGCGRSTTAGRPSRTASTGTYASFDWTQAPGNPGVDRLFGDAVYQRGGMTVYALRKTIGDAAFDRLLTTWTSEHRDGNADHRRPDQAGRAGLRQGPGRVLPGLALRHHQAAEALTIW